MNGKIKKTSLILVFFVVLLMIFNVSVVGLGQNFEAKEKNTREDNGEEDDEPDDGEPTAGLCTLNVFVYTDHPWGKLGLPFVLLICQDLTSSRAPRIGVTGPFGTARFYGLELDHKYRISTVDLFKSLDGEIVVNMDSRMKSGHMFIDF